MILDFKYSDEDEAGWAAPLAPAVETLEPVRGRAVDARSLDQVALAVAVGAMPVSELRRVLEGKVLPSAAPEAEPFAVCGAEDSCCGSFLDRYLGGGAEPDILDDAELFEIL